MAEPGGYQPEARDRQAARSATTSGSNAAVAQLFTRLAQEIEEQKPSNCIHFVVDFLCKHYPEHLHGFASIWQADPDLERERHEVVGFFKSHKISTAVAAHFTNAGFDTLDTLTTLSPDNLVDVEAFNNVKWLPGHKVRLQQIFAEISARVRAYKQQVAAHPVAAHPVHYVPSPAPMVSSPRSLAAPAVMLQPAVHYHSAGSDNTRMLSLTPAAATPTVAASAPTAGIPSPFQSVAAPGSYSPSPVAFSGYSQVAPTVHTPGGSNPFQTMAAGKSSSPYTMAGPTAQASAGSNPFQNAFTVQG